MTEKERRKDMRDAYRRAERQRRIDLCPLTEARLRSLVDHIDTKVLDVGCDHSTRHAVSWAESEGLEWTDLAGGIEELGGYCDCEIVMNVHPDDVFGR
jgi:hypothetical protein